MLLGHGCRAAGAGVLPLDACFWARLVELACAQLSVQRWRSRVQFGAASDALRQQSSPQPCCSACAVSRAPQQCPISSASVTETTRRQQPSPAGGSARRGRREESSAGARRRRGAPASAAGAEGTYRRAELSVGHSRVHGLCAPCTPRRRHRGVAAAPHMSQRARPPAVGHCHGRSQRTAAPGTRPSRRLARAHGRRRRGGCCATGRSGETKRGLREFR